LVALCILTFAGFTSAQTEGMNLKFINQTNYPAAIFWFGAGKEKLYKTLNGSENFSQSTSATHQWRVRLNGKLIGTYVAPAAPQQEIEITVSKSEAANTIRNQMDAQKHCIPISPSSPAVWIGKWGSLGEGQASFCEFAQLRFSEQKESALKGVTLNLVNKTKAPVQFYWVNESGKETSYGQIAAGATQTQSTFETHKWRFKLTNGKSIDEYVVTAQDSQKIEILYYMGEVSQIRSQKEAEQQCSKLAASKGGIWTGKWSELGDANAPFCELIRLRIGTDSK
jgi:hypothetical protein